MAPCHTGEGQLMFLGLLDISPFLCSLTFIEYLVLFLGTGETEP